MTYLLERGKDTAKEYMTLDREIYGPSSVASARTGGNVAVQPTTAGGQFASIPHMQPTPDEAAAYAYYQQTAANGTAA